MKKIIFVIPNLMHGGAERVLVNLVNNLDRSLFEITLLSVFDCGVNKGDLSPNIKYRFIYKKQFRGNSHYFKLFSPESLYKKFIGDGYDIAVSFLEGITARIVSGCNNNQTKTVCWIHTSLGDVSVLSLGFRDKAEAIQCYSRFDKIVCVSKSAESDFTANTQLRGKTEVIYNPIDSVKIKKLITEESQYPYTDGKFSVCAVGKLIPVKGFDRLAAVCKKLKQDGLNVHFYICGSGPEEDRLNELINKYGISDCFTLTSFLKNPYSVMAKCDLFVCSSYREGYSSAVCEALICSLPIVTVDVNGMREILGDNGGVICPNNDDALYNAIKKMITTPKMLDDFRKKAVEKGAALDMQKAVKQTENSLNSL